ncbi:MAG: hypothetical protein AUK44_06740 [Porphyromonadaceae bacterium CG2_30_38_12]|nr:MAG: hypothetical protein AUK44_06740 [Porphyromonadaceae bacterium CG2_30_38_12]
MKVFRFFIAFVFLFQWSACMRQAPQLPANKTNIVDSIGQSMQVSNERLIAGEDSLVRNFANNFASNTNKALTHSASGIWFHLETSSKLSEKLKTTNERTISYSIYNLERKLLTQKKETVKIGKKQVIAAIEELLVRMHKHDKAIIVAPWYMAYGMRGNGKSIPAYTSVLIYLQIEP